jgi:hypothetical protein
MSGRPVFVDRTEVDCVDSEEGTERRRCLVAFAQRLFAVVALLVLLGPNVSCAEEQASDSEIYHRAVDYCRGPVPRPMALGLDQRLLCFDGWVDEGIDLSPARDLKEFGLFVVRSLGGNDAAAVALSRLLRDRHATVIIYDFCLSICANSFFIASDQTYVMEGALVAWRNQADRFADCMSSEGSHEPRHKKIELASCPPFKDVTKYNDVSSVMARFYSERTVDPASEAPPASDHVKRLLKSLYDQTGVYKNMGWTLNPSHLTAFKTKIVYEDYPKSQAEVDAMAARLYIGKVIYDP